MHPDGDDTFPLQDLVHMLFQRDLNVSDWTLPVAKFREGDVVITKADGKVGTVQEACFDSDLWQQMVQTRSGYYNQNDVTLVCSAI